MPQLSTARALAFTTLCALVSILFGAPAGEAAPLPQDEPVTFKALNSTVSPYETVTVMIDHEKGAVWVEPAMAVIWYESRNPVSQILWTVRCVQSSRIGKGEVTCPPDVNVVIRPKGKCSRTLFGTSPGASRRGDILIAKGDNAVPSGTPNPKAIEGLLRPKGKPGEPCAEVVPCGPRESLKEELPMLLEESKYDHQWVYEVVVRRGEEELFRCDPEIWIEKDDSGG